MRALPNPVTWLGALLAVVGVAWLAPLMLDQLVLFGDRDQVARAAASRAVMIWPGLLVGAGALLLGAARRPMQAVAAGLPLIAVALAWIAPDTSWQILVYALTAPIAIGAVLGAVVPLRGRLPLPVILGGVVVLVVLVILAASILTALAAIGLVAWWILSRRARGERGSSALD